MDAFWRKLHVLLGENGLELCLLCFQNLRLRGASRGNMVGDYHFPEGRRAVPFKVKLER